MSRECSSEGNCQFSGNVIWDRILKSSFAILYAFINCLSRVFTKNWSSTLCHVKDHGQQQDKRQQVNFRIKETRER